MTLRRVLIGAIAVAVTASVIAVAVSAPAAPRTPQATASSNKAAAAKDARTLLSKVVLPDGATPVLRRPAWDPGGCPCPATPNAVDDHGWWRVPGNVHDVFAFLNAHHPAGSTVVATSGASGPGYTSQGLAFQWPEVPGVLSTRWLVVNVRSLPGGSAGIRADGVSVWLTPRAASDRVPMSKRLRISVVQGQRILQGPITIYSQAKVRKVVAFLNRLPAPQPGAFACPMDPGVRVIIDFYAARRAKRPAAVATIVVGGCGGGSLTVNGHREQGFGNPPVRPSGRDVSIEAAVGAIIGKRLQTGMPR